MSVHSIFMIYLFNLLQLSVAICELVLDVVKPSSARREEGPPRDYADSIICYSGMDRGKHQKL
jgi:hypothetical protein